MRVFPRLRYYVLLLAFCSVISSHAQFEGTMPFMRSLPQVTNYNPAFIPEYKLSVGILVSSLFANYSNDTFTYNDFISREKNTVNVDLPKLFEALNDENQISTSIHADIFRISLRTTPRLFLTFNVTAKANVYINLPNEVFALASEGTKFFVGKATTFSPKLESTSHFEIGLGGAYTVNRKLTLGLKLKLLKGITNFSTHRSNIDLSIDEDYNISTKVDFFVKNSGTRSFLDDIKDMNLNNINDINLDKISDKISDYSKNNGFAFDLGATYRIKDRLTLGVSVLDFGSIRWNNGLYGYETDKSKAHYNFRGISVNKLLKDNDNETLSQDNSREYFSEIMDTLKTRFTISEGLISPYSTFLPSKFYITGVYELRRNFTVAALFFGEYYMETFSPSFTTSLNKEFGRRLGASLSYTISNNSYDNIGAGLSLNLAPIQIYFVSDNILKIPIGMISEGNMNNFIKSSQLINFHAGINFIFNRVKGSEKHPHPNRLR